MGAIAGSPFPLPSTGLADAGGDGAEVVDEGTARMQMTDESAVPLLSGPGPYSSNFVLTSANAASTATFHPLPTQSLKGVPWISLAGLPNTLDVALDPLPFPRPET